MVDSNKSFQCQHGSYKLLGSSDALRPVKYEITDSRSATKLVTYFTKVAYFVTRRKNFSQKWLEAWNSINQTTGYRLISILSFYQSF